MSYIVTAGAQMLEVKFMVILVNDSYAQGISPEEAAKAVAPSEVSFRIPGGSQFSQLRVAASEVSFRIPGGSQFYQLRVAPSEDSFRILGGSQFYQLRVASIGFIRRQSHWWQ